MPRDRGFRDPNLIRIATEYIQITGRLTQHRYANSLVVAIPHEKQLLLRYKAERAEARHSVKRWRAGQRTLPLDGIIFSFKDNIGTYDLPTTCASNILAGFRTPLKSTVETLLRREGALVLSKTNMDEFGMGSHSTHSAYGPVKNGRTHHALSAGGSSGGSAFAVAAAQCHIALGTDTGGSVRLPAAYMGLVGFKPSYGLISRHGVVPYANSLDTVGILAKNCLDVFLAFQALAQYDPQDPTSLSNSSRTRIREAKNQRRNRAAKGSLYRIVPVTGHSSARHRLHDFPHSRRPIFPSSTPSTTLRRIGFPIEYNIAELHPLVRSAWNATLAMLEAAGHTVVPITLPSTKAALSAYYVLAPAEASSNLAKYDGVRYGPITQTSSDAGGRLFAAHRGALFGEEVKRRILLGAFSLSADAIDNYFIQAQKVRRLVQQDFDYVFRMKNPLHNEVKPSEHGVDFIVCPTAPTPPPVLVDVAEQTPLDAYVNDVFTVPASLAGLPAISVPAPLRAGSDIHASRFVGMQVIGQYGDDFGVIQFAKNAFENTANWDFLERIHEVARFH